MAQQVLEVFGRVDDPDLYFSHHVANVSPTETFVFTLTFTVCDTANS